MNFADKIIYFNQNLKFTGKLPVGYFVMNPFLDNPETLEVMKRFYQKFYADQYERRFLIGINPSRHGAGVTGVPFTDTKRLASACGVQMLSARTHEISSVYMYDMIAAYGGASAFYRNFYINSPFPLAIIKEVTPGQFINANYYDKPELYMAVKDFMIESLKKHIAMGLNQEEVFILGKKNAKFIDKLNREGKFFKKLTVLEHPRFIQQYKSKERQLYIDKYLLSFHPSDES